MNLDPKNSRNFEESVRRSARLNQGKRLPVGDGRMTVRQVAKAIGKSVSRTHTLLETYTAEKLIQKEGK